MPLKASRRALVGLLLIGAWLMAWLTFAGGEQASSPALPVIAESPAAALSAASDLPPMEYRRPPTTTTLPPTTTTAAPTTTTTAAPSPPPPAPPPPAPPSSGGYADPNNPATWDRLAQCESGGNWAINTGNGYYGGLQFALSSWRGVGGTGYPHEHSREEQIHRAQLLWQSGGWNHWPACSSKLGYR